MTIGYTKGDGRQYIVISASAIHILEHTVNEAMKDGYTPQGGVSGHAEHYMQAMVKIDPAKRMPIIG